ncbi:type II secretion system protein [Ideonella paludis]|uniref:Type II secretion system protein n=1 Tax=Ideonella paludis TaxID=1233411 RepID=A0ABS5E0Y5_9BURK|nr:type II secretion system protein [Ideonella paludis]MBQ0937055.1 type II secretion system protein [Ideonella paludis]
MKPSRRYRQRTAGFTLIELIVVMVITVIMSVSLVVFFRPAIDGYFLSQTRDDLMQAADNAIMHMANDVRAAVPNSVRTPNNQCFELVPTVAGGRYRAGPDTVNDAACTGAGCSAWVDTSAATTTFDVLQHSGRDAQVGDWVVINNQNANDVHAGSNRSQITAVSTPAAALGVKRFTINSLQVSPGYDGARYQVVSNNEQSVTYSCLGADGTLDAKGNGKGELRRKINTFATAVPTSCPLDGYIVTRNVLRCNFVYDPNQGATQQSGFVWMEIEVARAGEKANLSMGAHVSNVP